MTSSFDDGSASYELEFGDQKLTGAEEERLVSGRAETAERDAEAALRPKGLQDFIEYQGELLSDQGGGGGGGESR
ncbi:MAG: hypothetical protein ACTMIL_13500, partial [Brevibacterium aurantiacum]